MSVAVTVTMAAEVAADLHVSVTVTTFRGRAGDYDRGRGRGRGCLSPARPAPPSQRLRQVSPIQRFRPAILSQRLFKPECFRRLK